MERALRLTYDADFRRVRTHGKSWAHPFAILCALPNNLPHNRYGFSVSKRIGGAVVRNRVKRLLREAVRTTPQDVGPIVCSCFGIGQHQISAEIKKGAASVEDVGRCLKAGTNCGACKPEIGKLLNAAPAAKPQPA